MRRISCVLALLCMLGAAGLLAWDLAAAGGEALRLRPLGEVWYQLDAGSLNLSQAVIERYVWPPLWDPGVITLLQVPAALLLAGLAGLLLLLCLTRAARARRRVAP